MKKIIQKLKNYLFTHETIRQSKQKWDKLAKEDAKFFIWSIKKNQSEEEFRNSGRNDYELLVRSDDVIMKLKQERKWKDALEIGCGIGRMTEFFANDFEKIIGIDISGEMIRLAKERLRQVKNVIFFETEGVSLPCHDASIDFCFSFIVFQHMPTADVVKKTICEVGRVLRRGGGVKVQLRGVPTNKGEWYSGVYLDEAEVRHMFEEAGLHIISVSGVGQKYFWIIAEKLF